MIKYFVLIDGAQKGPFSKSQMTSMWNAGQITSESLYWFEGIGSDWQPVGDMFEPAPPPVAAKIIPKLDYAHITKPKEKISGWTGGQYAVLVILTAIIPLIGFILGFLRVWDPGKRKQAGQLIVFSLVVAAFGVFVLPALVQTYLS